METEDFLDFAKLGAYNQFDLFGNECSYYQLAPEFDMPSDAVRIDRVKQLIEDKKEDRILLSHDLHTKHKLVSYILNSIYHKLH